MGRAPKRTEVSGARTEQPSAPPTSMQLKQGEALRFGGHWGRDEPPFPSAPAGQGQAAAPASTGTQLLGTACPGRESSPIHSLQCRLKRRQRMGWSTKMGEESPRLRERMRHASYSPPSLLAAPSPERG